MLFHKKEVTEGARGAMGDELSRAILSPNHRVVGVVINAIDDRLSSASRFVMTGRSIASAHLVRS